MHLGEKKMKKKIKKILKILVIVMASMVLLSVVLMAGNIILYKCIEKYHWNDTTEETEEKPEVYIEYNAKDLKQQRAEEDIPDSSYYDSIQQAISNANFALDEKEQYHRNIDEIIQQFESDKYLLVYTRSVKNKKEECLALTKFRKKEIDGETKYTFLATEPVEARKGAKKTGTDLEMIKTMFIFSDYNQDMNVDPENTRFAWGITSTKEIYNLKVEGQSPSGIVPYDVFGETEYFWYYENLESKKAGSTLEVELGAETETK